MKKLEVSNGLWKIDFIIENNKILLGYNYCKKYSIKQLLKSYFFSNETEFRKENELIVKLDDDKLLLKRTNYMEISPYYSINEDCKLGTKSLLTKYYEVLLNDFELFDSINTLDFLFEGLANDLSGENILQSEFVKMNSKQLIKLLKPYYVDEYQKDEYDISYEDLILFQIYIIQKIQEKSLYEDTIIIADIPVLTEKIYKEIDSIKNANIIIFTNNYCSNIDMEKIVLIENAIVDLADKYYIYELFGESNGERKNMEEVYEMLKQFIIKKYAYKNVNIIQELETFSLT